MAWGAQLGYTGALQDVFLKFAGSGAGAGPGARTLDPCLGDRCLMAAARGGISCHGVFEHLAAPPPGLVAQRCAAWRSSNPKISSPGWRDARSRLVRCLRSIEAFGSSEPSVFLQSCGLPPVP